MRKALLFISLSFLIVITACQSAESKEVLEYHNGFVDEVISRDEIITEAYDEIDTVETDEEAIVIANDKILPTLEEMKKHMDAQNPEKDDTKEYHKLRMEWFELYEEIIKLELQALEDYVNDVITDEEFIEIFEEVYEKSETLQEILDKGEEKADELAEKYEFEVINE
jgi:hypothetical protein